MNLNYQQFIKLIISTNLNEVFSDANIGFEKESLRVIDSKISKSPHPEALGSALCNEKITTDFSEAQLELITPPLKGGSQSLLALDQIHYFVSANIDDEILWPLSMPPTIDSEEDIPIANYGSCHLGIFKRIYRNGLSKRYGRTMQAISGFHFNYSLPNSIWEHLPKTTGEDINKIKSDVYLNMLRNTFRMNWLILYLFGASPVLTKNNLKKENEKFKQLDGDTFYLPYATSLRMSDYGYCNLGRRNTFVSLNSINDYVTDIRSATITNDPRFSTFEEKTELQLNSNILQIEDEYYAVARAKSNLNSYKRTSSNLFQGGVDFIEIRSLDLDPFSRNGIDLDTILFLEVFMIFCFTETSDPIDQDQLAIINQNDLSVAKFGRKPELMLTEGDREISLRKWADKILKKMLLIAEKMDQGESKYVDIINANKIKIKEPSRTSSGLLIEKLISENISHIDLGNYLGKLNKKYYLDNYDSAFMESQYFEDEAINSLQKQIILEKETVESKKTFEEYKLDYSKY